MDVGVCGHQLLCRCCLLVQKKMCFVLFSKLCQYIKKCSTQSFVFLFSCESYPHCGISSGGWWLLFWEIHKYSHSQVSIWRRATFPHYFLASVFNFFRYFPACWVFFPSISHVLSFSHNFLRRIGSSWAHGDCDCLFFCAFCIDKCCKGIRW